MMFGTSNGSNVAESGTGFKSVTLPSPVKEIVVEIIPEDRGLIRRIKSEGHGESIAVLL
jgi:hypothetical protein